MFPKARLVKKEDTADAAVFNMKKVFIANPAACKAFLEWLEADTEAVEEEYVSLAKASLLEPHKRETALLKLGMYMARKDIYTFVTKLKDEN